MKLLMIAVAFLAVSARAEEAPKEKGFTMLKCTYDPRMHAPGYRGLLIHRVGEGPYEIVQYKETGDQFGPKELKVERTVIAEKAECDPLKGRNLTTRCKASGFELTLKHDVVEKIGKPTKQSYEVSFTKGEKFTFGTRASASVRDFCEALE